ncbi:hypothetical protein [Cyanobium sp. CH-040]|uniref:hypothetical protein n=1 Tax=Cyanobium sp. CH-040 TaxID=2823708 RepID=UPI0020CD0BD2|nr:hypothetical protein [Cyanobium sp. CH-040]MCP9928766.1 hypothetical protein [Cyanobium sp. CH-040]
MACPHCGSWSVKADRSLAGRLVCGRCGRPLGPGAARRSRSAGGSGRPGRGRRRVRWLWLGALLAVSALLARLAEPPAAPPRGPSPAPQWLSGAGSQPWR